jgi:hypothetical protein
MKDERSHGRVDAAAERAHHPAVTDLLPDPDVASSTNDAIVQSPVQPQIVNAIAENVEAALV